MAYTNTSHHGNAHIKGTLKAKSTLSISGITTALKGIKAKSTLSVSGAVTAASGTFTDMNIRTSFVKGVTVSNFSLVGIATADKLKSVSRASIAAAGSILKVADTTIAQWSISAANTLHKNGAPKVFDGNNLLIVTWLDASGV